MKNIYVISGLGADQRVFFKTDFGNNNVSHLPWLTPLKNESIENYALRLSKAITHENPILVGLSFGGMLAMEVAKHIAVEKIILISSAKTKYELPIYFRAAGKLRLQKLVPTVFLKKANIFTNWAFSSRTKLDKIQLAAMIKDADIVFVKWAVEKILLWKNETIPNNVFHIHGTADRLLPRRFTKNTIAIKGGPHLMIVSKYKEVNEQLVNIINS